MKNLFSMSYGIIISAGLLGSPLAKANSDSDIAKCMESAQTTVAMNECLTRELNAADDKLNKIYAKFKESLRQTENVNDTYLKEVEKETIERLVNAERAWIDFRDSQCRFEGAQMLGGTGESGVILMCLIRMTNQRIADIEAMDKAFNWDH